MNSSGIIEVRNISKKFGKTVALADLSFSVRKEELFSLLGPSGCGKTTALRAIAGLGDIDTGEIWLDGKLVASVEKKYFVPPERRDVGMVFQGYALWPHMNVYDNIAYGIRVKKLKDERKRVEEVLRLVGLSGYERRYPSQLSGGQQQRVAVARTLVYEPKILLLDEPLSNLDQKEREHMRAELRKLLTALKITGLYVTHDQEEAFALCDRVMVMRSGSVVQEGTPTEIYKSPRDEFMASFIGRANMLKVIVKEMHEGRAVLEAPALNADLACSSSQILQKGKEFMVIIRPDEVEISDSKPAHEDNVFQGRIVEREFKGASADYRATVGNFELIVSTHKRDFVDKLRPVGELVYLHVPLAGITVIPNQ